MTLQICILAAGMGARLGRPLPKPLTQLADGRSILAQQLTNICAALGESSRIMIVVGFKAPLIMEAFPDLLYVYNPEYDRNNTAKSLLRALKASSEGGVLWMNGDVVFDAELLRLALPLIESEQSFVCVNTSAVGEEEIKYTLDEAGLIRELSKGVVDGVGEGVGINYVSASEKARLIRRLELCAEDDYFERGIEVSIAEDRSPYVALNIAGLFAVEVDTEEDLAVANATSQRIGSQSRWR
jgi:choline kinase